MIIRSSLYDILVLPPAVLIDEIKSAFKKLAIQHHPDRNQSSPESTTRFRVIYNAHSRLAEVSTPTLIIWGKNDSFITYEHGVLLHQKLKQSRLEILDHCGHNPQEDRPQEVNQLIVETFS